MKRILYYQSNEPLKDLAEACLSLTPNLFAPTASDLYLEIGGTQKIFGGEAALLLKADHLVDSFGVERQVVLTDRPEWAKALSVAPEVLLAPGKSHDFLWRLPIERVEWCGNPHTLEEEAGERRDLTVFLRKVGLGVIGEFANLTPTSVNRRFGKFGVELREWSRGERELVFPPFQILEPVREEIDTEDVSSLDSLLLYLSQALVKIELRLRGRAILAKKIRLNFCLESRRRLVRSLDLSHPMQEAQAILKVLKEFLAETQWDSPLTRFEIEITDVVPWSPGQLMLFDSGENRFHDLADFVARLRAKLGDESVGFANFEESYLPEHSWRNVWPPCLASPALFFPERPLFLFSPPKRCPPPTGWSLSHSEDVASAWWEAPVDRSYYVAKNSEGEFLWIYFDNLRKEWFLHGVFD